MAIFDNMSEDTMKTFEDYMMMETTDWEQYIDQGVTSGVILGVINELKATNHTLSRARNKLAKTELEYQVLFLEKVNSKEYNEQYKTIKQREQMATLEYKAIKEEITDLQEEVDHLRSNKEGLEQELKFLYKIWELAQYEPTEEGECQCRKQPTK